MFNRSCLPPPCPRPVTGGVLPSPVCSPEYDVTGIFGAVSSTMPAAHDIVSSCPPGAILPGLIAGADTGFLPPRMPDMIARCPIPAGCAPRPCPPQVIAIPAGPDGRPAPLPIPPSRPFIPLTPGPTGGGGGGGGGSGRIPLTPGPTGGGGGPFIPLTPGPTGRRPFIPLTPGPRRPTGRIPAPGTPPPAKGPGGLYPPLMTAPRVPGGRTPTTRTPVSYRPGAPRTPVTGDPRFQVPLSRRPAVYRPPVSPGRNPDLYTSINGFGNVQTEVRVSGGGIFDAPATLTPAHDLPFRPHNGVVMIPPGCPPALAAPCAAPTYDAPVLTMPGYQPCPAPATRCPGVPTYDVVVPAPVAGCQGFGAYLAPRRGWQDPPDPEFTWRRQPPDPGRGFAMTSMARRNVWW